MISMLQMLTENIVKTRRSPPTLNEKVGQVNIKINARSWQGNFAKREQPGWKEASVPKNNIIAWTRSKHVQS